MMISKESGEQNLLSSVDEQKVLLLYFVLISFREILALKPVAMV